MTRPRAAELVGASADWVAARAGWQRSALALALGLLGTAALPPIHALPLLVVSLTGLVWLIACSRSPWRAFIAGWWFGVGHFIASIYWVSAALMVDADRFGWLAAPAVAGLSAAFALYPALVALVVRLSPLRGASRVIAFALAWTAAEWLRGHILTGFPMNLMATVWSPSVGMIQVVALTGAFGLSLITVLAAAAPAALAEPGSRAGATGARARRWPFVAGAFALLALVWLGGNIRLALAPDAEPTGIRLRIVQANIDQALKWRPDERLKVVERHVRLSRAADADRIDHIVWPEAAIPFFLDENPALRAFLAQAVPPGGYLITGAPRRRVVDGRTRTLWNSLYVLGPDGTPAEVYDKHHLVPFGEYIPLRALLSLPKLTFGELDYTAGPGPRTLRVTGLPGFSPLICYEAIFPGDAVDAADRPRWLVNVTNDAWFGETAGPHQHFHTARLRAVEEGLPLVRAANTGISAVVDPYGRVLSTLGIGVEGVLDAELPPALAAPTPYARVGDGAILGLFLFGFGALLVAARGPRGITGKRV